MKVHKKDDLSRKLDEILSSETRPRLMLHACCAPCSTHILDILKEPFDLAVYFYDPNIQPRDEYERRRDEMKGYAGRFSIPFFEGDYDTGRWFEMMSGHESEQEGGERCFLCYEMRLTETARFARENGYLFFATVLSISPHKNSAKINEIGLSLASRMGLHFLDADFKKKDGFKRSLELSREYGLYRQDYCGCLFSRRGRMA